VGVVLIAGEAAETVTRVQGVQFAQVFVGKLKVEHVQIGLNSGGGDTLWNDDHTALNLELDEDMTGGLLVLRGEFLDDRMVEKSWLVLGFHLSGSIGRAQGAIRRQRDLLVLAELEKLALVEVRMTLNLVHDRLNLSFFEDARDLFAVEVRQANAPHLSSLMELFHALPRVHVVHNGSDHIPLTIPRE